MAGLRIGVTTFLVGLCVLLAGCGGGDKPKTSVEELADKDYKPEFGEAKEFDPSGWQTNEDFPPLGDPRAKRVPGSTFVIPWTTYPPTLRTEGPNSNLVQTRLIHAMHYELLLGVHPETQDFVPGLATHWKIEDNPDKTQTFWFRLNPKAKWSDGNPVTSDDVLATWWHRTQEDRQEPTSVMTFGEGYEEPEIVDQLTIKVKTKKQNWRLFLYFSAGMRILPARYIRIPGKQYLEDYNWRMMPGSGPYYMKPEDLKQGESLVLTRRDDYWDEDGRGFKNTYNFDRIKFITVRDRELQYEKFKKGELDWFYVSRAQRWVEDVPKEKIVQKGWVKRRKIFNEAAQGFQGFAFNMRKWPFNDKRVRMAFAHLYNRERLMEKLFFNEYDYIKSIFPGRDWGNGANRERVYFDPDRAAELLAEAGYKERNDDGYLVGPDGKVLEVTLPYPLQQWERIWLVVKEDYEDAGVKFNLKLLDYATLIKMVGERQFTIHNQSYTGLTFPNPETSWRSDLADKKHNNNIPGFKNKRVDELCAKYNVTYDRSEQKEITREIDEIVWNEYPYAFGWFSNHLRVLYWDKFGHPATYWSRTGDTPSEEMVAYWWADPEKAKRMQKARDNEEALPQGQIVHKPWAGGGNK